MTSPWSPPPCPLLLSAEDVDVWRIALRPAEGALQQAGRVLSAEERERAARFHFDEDRQAYVVCRAAVRTILGKYLSVEPSSLMIETGEFGKPALPAKVGLQFNIAHSGDLALCAVSRRWEVGVDIEKHRTLPDMEQVARRFFSPGENAALWSLPADEREQGFFNAWTRKEAYIKGRGLGLSLPLDLFDVSLAPGESARLLASREPNYSADHWRLHALDAPAGYTAALAIAGEGWRLRCWTFE